MEEVHDQLSPSILDSILLHHILKNEAKLIMYQVFDGPLIEVTTMAQLSLGWPKSGRNCLIKERFNLNFSIIISGL